MFYDAISKRLFLGAISPDQARHEAISEFNDQCLVAEKRWADCNLLPHAEKILAEAVEVVEDNLYLPCARAGFFAALYSRATRQLVTEIERTRTPPGTFNCQFNSRNSCIRDRTGISGDRYDNCLSVHAAQWLKVPDDCRPSQVMWMEAGAVRGLYVMELANSSDDPFSRVYRCSMCLKTMLGQGVVDLCSIGQDSEGKPRLQLAPIDATLNTLVIMNCADMLEKSC